MKRNYGNTSLLVIFLIVGLLLGDALGQAFGGYLPLLSYGKNVGLSATKLDLGILSLTFGFDISLNLAGAIGLILAIALFRRM
ncbi:MAG: DUF4321 domain-containing protein [Tepidanaerobacteraceae bacterium]